MQSVRDPSFHKWIPDRRATMGIIGGISPPKISKHCIAKHYTLSKHCTLSNSKDEILRHRMKFHENCLPPKWRPDWTLIPEIRYITQIGMTNPLSTARTERFFVPQADQKSDRKHVRLCGWQNGHFPPGTWDRESKFSRKHKFNS